MSRILIFLKVQVWQKRWFTRGGKETFWNGLWSVLDNLFTPLQEIKKKKSILIYFLQCIHWEWFNMAVDHLSWNTVLEKNFQGKRCYSARSFNTGTLFWPAFNCSSAIFCLISHTGFLFCTLTDFGAVLLDLLHLRAKVVHWVKSRPRGSQWQSSHWL